MESLLEIYPLFAIALNMIWIMTAPVLIFALLRAMKAQERMAHSVARIADATERIEEIIRRDKEPRV
jgi:hypothetical protein